MRANSDDLKRFHGTNERLSVEGYADMIRFYRRLIENSGGVTIFCSLAPLCGEAVAERSVRESDDERPMAAAPDPDPAP